jgi:hypothetical protein
MEIFAKLFGSLLALVYHCFDRIVILGHLPLLTRPENIVHFFRDIHQVEIISKEVLRQRTDDYHHWVEAFARKRGLGRRRIAMPRATEEYEWHCSGTDLGRTVPVRIWLNKSQFAH